MDDKRLKTAIFTGHRHIDNEDMPDLLRRIDETIEGLIRQGVVFWGCGGAIGFDQMAGFAVLRLRAKYPFIKLIMVLPCHGQESRWTESDKQAYKRLLDDADKVVYVSDYYYDGVMAIRNKYLTEHSGVCVAYLRRWDSGTGQTVRRAQAQGLEVINLAE